MRLVVLDLEMNQPSRKIIQIGAVMVDTKQERMLTYFNQYVDPKEKISKYIEELTGINQDMVDEQPTIDEAGKLFWDWAKEQNCGMRIGAWGSDVYELDQQCKSPYRFQNHNIKALAEWYRDILPGKQQGGLQSTLFVLGKEFQGTPHNALFDAINAARIAFDITKALAQHQQIKNILK